MNLLINRASGLVEGLHPVRGIIFDLGGVILNIDYGKTIAAFEALGFSNFSAIFSNIHQVEIFHKFEKGWINAGEFRMGINALSPVPLRDAEIDRAWNAMLLDLPPDRITFLESICHSYKLFLLSNINAIHITAFLNILESTVGIKRFNGLFERVYYSSDIGMRKPDPEIFNYVLCENGLSAGETLFLDDTPQHIASASRLGIRSILMGNGKEFAELLANANNVVEMNEGG